MMDVRSVCDSGWREMGYWPASAIKAGEGGMTMEMGSEVEPARPGAGAGGWV
jgi:hypothetical protein